MKQSKIKYRIEKFTNDEEQVLNKYFTNIDKPVFGLINLPDVVKGALFARYSRSNKSLRRLFLDEFFKDGDIISSVTTEVGIKRASSLYDKMILEYGDDSVAQLGGAHLACEQVSNILTKVLEKGRIASYLEKSTRYVFYHNKVDGKYNFYTPYEFKNSTIKSEFEEYVNELFDTYSYLVSELNSRLKEKFPKTSDQSSRAWENTINAKSCDIVRGLLPGCTITNLGIYASGQSYEYLLIKMFASKNEEVRNYAEMMLVELRKMIPSFLKRVDLNDRGILWSQYIAETESNMCNKYDVTTKLKLNKPNNEITVDLLDWDEDAINKVVATILYEFSEVSDRRIHDYVYTLSEEDKYYIIKDYIGNRKNRRHKPGRALESINYRFDIEADYGAFRDLQRHRILTQVWQKISPHNGYVIPFELQEYPDLLNKYVSVVNKSPGIYLKVRDEFGFELAQYTVPFAYKVRFMFIFNLRQAYHLIELRTQKQGHPSYRKVCLDMLDLIENKANHRIFTDSMIYADKSPHYDLSRYELEKNIDVKLEKFQNGTK